MASALKKQAGAASGIALLIKTGVEDMEEKAVRKWLSWILRCGVVGSRS